MRRRQVVIALVTCMAVIAGAAWGYWSISSTSGGNGAAESTSVDQGATPTVSVVGQQVTVSWGATTLANGVEVSGFRIKRYDSGTSTSQTMLSSCAGTVLTTACTESAVPGGSWTYTVTPVRGVNWRGPESAKSAIVVVDSTPPTNSLALSSVSGGAVLNGSNVYYRGVAAGGFALTNTVTDSGSGPASSRTSTLSGTSTGWAHAPSTVSTPAGGPYVSSPFAWTAGTSSSPGEVVTGRDVSGNTATSSLTFINDSTPPGAGTITYAHGNTSGLSVSITFTTGTDGGAGIATRVIQRSAALLSGGACGSFSAFADLSSDLPNSPYVDNSVANGSCYKYRYVVTDRVGNQDIATSSSVAKVDYAATVGATNGLLSHWRLGEGAASLTSSDSFTDSPGTALSSHTGELRATWVHRAGIASAQISPNGRVRRGGVQDGYSIDYTTATPTTADYSVEADVFVRSILAGDSVGVIGRMDTATNTFYLARWEQSNTSWNLVKYTNGSWVSLGSLAGEPALTVSEAYRLRLDMNGTALKLFVNGVLKVSGTDATLSAAGKAGIMHGMDTVSPATTDTTGLRFDNFQVTPSTYPRAADSNGPNTGAYKNGVTLGVAGALLGDTNTAAMFDGLNDYVNVSVPTGIPVGASVRSTELWFKTSSPDKQVLFSYGSGASTQSYALWLNAGGGSMTAYGYGTGNDKTFTMPAAVNNGAWHQVVQTYDGSSLTIYIDGVALASQAAVRSTVMSTYGFTIGAILRTSDSNFGGFFDGAIDEVSFYSTTLSQAAVTNHYGLGTTAAADINGPTGGSVDASGLVGTLGRYAASTTLSLTLAKGTDPSGVAATGSQLLRATATFNSGDDVCGAFGTYTLVSGGTDPASPKSDVVTDQACYRYQYVVLDNLGNSTTYTSPRIKVDLTAPASTTLGFTDFSNTYWAGSGTVYYRATATTGSFTATATSSDSASGIASYGFPGLGSNWTSTPGALGVNTYSWSGAPAAPGTTNVTATNNAAGTSAGTPFTLTADNTAPTAGTVSYTGGTTTDTVTSVSFTTGTDGGSGIGIRLLQRASAPLIGATCGAFGSFATVTNGTNPRSPFADTVPRDSCYQYRYVVSDNVGNTNTATSAAIIKASSSYFSLVSKTSGLVGYWRLDEPSGTTMGDSKGTNTGFYGGGPLLGSTGALTNDADKSATFDGVDDVGTVPDSATLKPSNVTIEAWVKPSTGMLTYASVATKTALNSDGYAMYSGNGAIHFWVNDYTHNVWTAALPTNAWSHVVGTYDGAKIKIYLNGTLVDQLVYSSPMAYSTAPLLIGDAAGASTYHWTGGLDDVSIYNRALTANEVAAHYGAR
jgi:hypothetical protein